MRTVRAVVIALAVCLLVILGSPLLAPTVGSVDKHIASGQRGIASEISGSGVFNEESETCRLASDTYTSAHIISRPPAIPYDALALDRGSEDGVEVGDYVGVMDQASDTLDTTISIIGSIHTVFPKTSQVILFSSPDTSHSVSHLPTGTTLSLLGKGGGEFTLDVPRDMPLEVGDVFNDVRTRLPLARIVALRRDDRDPLQTLYAHMPVPLSKMQCVVVWHSPLM